MVGDLALATMSTQFRMADCVISNESDASAYMLSLLAWRVPCEAIKKSNEELQGLPNSLDVDLAMARGRDEWGLAC